MDWMGRRSRLSYYCQSFLLLSSALRPDSVSVLTFLVTLANYMKKNPIFRDLGIAYSLLKV